MSFCFISLAFFKSVFILLGLGLIFPWPGEIFASFHNLALPVTQVLPYFLLWSAGIYLLYWLVVRHARQTSLRTARPAPSRLEDLFKNVMDDYRRNPCPQCEDDLCCPIEQDQPPVLLISDRLNSPLALTDGGEPAILFPASLIAQLTDAELKGALAHEMAHFVLRRPSWCSAGTLQKLTLIHPVAGLAGMYLHLQEEKACDDLAVSIVGQPEVYAEMLIKSYRFARQQAHPTMISNLNLLPRLLGFKPTLSERIEHLFNTTTTLKRARPLRVIDWLVWATLLVILFIARF
jgi:Zn-dependent protease with chaperone function